AVPSTFCSPSQVLGPVSPVSWLGTGTVLFAASSETRVDGAWLEVADLKQLIPEFVSKGLEFFQSFGHGASSLTYIIQSDYQPKKKKSKNPPTNLSHALSQLRIADFGFADFRLRNPSRSQIRNPKYEIGNLHDSLRFRDYNELVSVERKPDV